MVKARRCGIRPSARLELHGSKFDALGTKLGKIEASKPCTKVHQQPWSDVFEGVEGGGATLTGSVFASGLKTLGKKQSSINSAYACRRLAQRIVVSAAER